jgi:thiol-disulfide isomerase/thioredoxin
MSCRSGFQRLTVIWARMAAAFLLATWTGCRPPERSASASSRPAAAEKAYPAPLFSAVSFSEPDQRITLDAFKGKVLLVDFWATWCPPCRHEIPALNKLYAEYSSRGFEILGMTVDQGDPVAISQGVGKLGVRYPTVLADAEVQQAFGGIRVVPTKFLLDKDGHIRKSYQGVVPEQVLRDDIESLLAL